MKKLLSILTVLLVVTAMLHFSVARHYCHGEMVASKVSLSGALATCGMEDNEGDCRHGHNEDLFDSHCCDDVVTSYFLDNTYTPATKAKSGLDHAKLQVPVMPVEKPARVAFTEARSLSDISPPGGLMTSSVDLPQIRVFRI
ncbi:MAG TPA: hypothetical protein PKK03_11855 [Bacteroidales bacterium]|nr:hypothetical protein [Bacteroidales bacterium]HNX85134.1 hypothetical protein [Bacteroidales bacterium]HOC48618.1 hypothetical protein [Bacteroidales bacterium]HPS98023.1 hypothetical protein [Bacteroidales bacterium]HQN59447.1 hypothetical protein [Bacteroidales bacterium]